MYSNIVSNVFKYFIQSNQIIRFEYLILKLFNFIQNNKRTKNTHLIRFKSIV